MKRRDAEPHDRRVARSRAAIRTALYELVCEKPYAQISVTELAERAGLNRKTFYAHYASLDDVVDELEEEFAENLHRILEESDFYDTGRLPQDVMHCVEHAVRENYELLQCMSGSNGFDVIRRRVEHATRGVIAKKLEQYPAIVPADREYLAQFLAAGVVSMFVYWLRGDAERPINEVAKLADQAIYYGLASYVSHP